MRFSIRDLVYIGVFGALWGAVETTSGSLLHVLNIPFSGVVLAGVGIIIALIGRLFVPQRGSVLAIGMVTAMLKMFSIGGIVLMPVIGILAESLIAELALTVLASHDAASFVIAGGLATLWPFFHPFFTQGFLAGSGIFTIYQRTIQKGAQALGLPVTAVFYVLAALLVLHLVIGLIGGLVAWEAGRLIQARLRPDLSEQTA